MVEERKTAPVAGAEKTHIGEIRQCNDVESYIHTLRCLLHYHERMMLGHRQCPGGKCEKVNTCSVLEGKCPNAVFIDEYAEALKEAIRCIKIVHKGELTE